MRGDSGFRHPGAPKPGFDTFGTPAPTTFGSLGGMTTPPAVSLSRRYGTPEKMERGLRPGELNVWEGVCEPRCPEQTILREFVEGD